MLEETLKTFQFHILQALRNQNIKDQSCKCIPGFPFEEYMNDEDEPY